MYNSDKNIQNIENIKYNCINLHYLYMESGLIEVPQDSEKTYIVKPVQENDYGVVNNVIYQYMNGEWVDTGEYFEGKIGE